MRIRFWGTRGSLPRPFPDVLRYGGNTSCVEVRADDGTLVVLDAGTGIYPLGHELLASSQGPPGGSLLITHTHWDHIQGFPFFAPLFIHGSSWNIYAPGGMGQKLEQTLAGQMSYSYFPVTLDELGAKIRYFDLREGSIDIGSIRVSAHYANHPALTLGYRLEAGGRTVVYIPDHEPNSLYPLNAVPGTMPVHLEDQAHIEFLRDADLLIHDAQYTLEEYEKKIGWGHTPMEKAVDYAVAGQVERLALFHHDPLRKDEEVDGHVEVARRRASEGSHKPDVFAAAEGQVITLEEETGGERPNFQDASSALLARAQTDSRKSVLIVDDDVDITRVLSAAFDSEGFQILIAEDGESAIRTAREKRPSLILLDLMLPDIDGFQVCRTLRSSPEPRIHNVPIVAFTGERLEEKDVVDCYKAGATDYVKKPVTIAQLRSRLRGWLIRTERL